MSEEMRTSASDKAAWVGKLQYSRSFMAKLALSAQEVREYYALLVTALLSYEKMNARVGWAGVTFMAGRRTAARVTINGKTLCLFLAAEPETVTGARYKALAVTARKYEKTPALLKIRSRGATRNAVRRIDETAALLGLSKKAAEFPPVSAANFPADNFGNLLARGLIRVLRSGKGVKAAFAAEEEELLPCGPGERTANAPETDEEKTVGADTAASTEKPPKADAAASAKMTAADDAFSVQNDKNASEPPPAKGEKGGAEKPQHPKHTDRSYADTVTTTKELLSRHGDYAAIMSALQDGQATVRVTDRYVVRAIDELWVKTIEESLFAIDEIIRHPTGFIAETEEVLPIELTKKVTGRSIVHLAQHSDYISKDEDDRLTPTKLLNVFREDSLLTYENKFINTLLSRLAFFIDRRYEVWTRRGADERIRKTEYANSFDLGNSHGKVTVTVEMSEETENDGGVRNTTYDTDLFRRVSRLHGIAESYMKSPFVRSMGRNYVHPPILRTNAILKNKYFRQCLALWEFIESYEDAGYGLLVEEKAVHVSHAYLRELYEGAAMQYLLFCHEVCEGFGIGHNLSVVFAPANSKLQAKIDGEYHYPEDEENAFSSAENSAETSAKVSLLAERTAHEAEIIAAVEAALLADEMTEKADVTAPGAELLFHDEGADGIFLPDTGKREETDAAESAHDVTFEAEEAKAGKDTEENVPSDGQISEGRLYRSFTARLCELEDEGKENLVAIANRILRYPAVSMRVGRDFMTFRHKKRIIARIAIRGKSLYVYLPLVPEETEERFRLRHSEGAERLEGTPSLLLVRSARSVRYAMELTERICDSYRIGAPLPDGKHPVLKASDYPRRTLREMIAMGLIHVSGKLNGVPEEGFSAAERTRAGKAAETGTDGKATAAAKAEATRAFAGDVLGAVPSEGEIPGENEQPANDREEIPRRHHAPKEAAGEPLRPETGTLPYAEMQRAGSAAVGIGSGAETLMGFPPEKAPDPTPDHDTSAEGERVGAEQPLSWQASEDYSQPEMFGLDDSSGFMADIREQEMKNDPEKKDEKKHKD